MSDAPLPPDATSSKTSNRIAWLMDEVIPVPGTNVKIGLDPLLGLVNSLGIPVGDLTSNSVSCIALLEAIRRGLPIKAMFHILSNIFVNLGVGAVPVIGDIFSMLFRSNSRNRDVINQYLREAVAAGKEPSWWRVIGLGSVVVIFVLGLMTAYVILWLWLWSQLASFLGIKLPFSEG